MSILTWFETATGVTESFVVSVITKLGTGVQVVIADIESSWGWIGAHAGEISSDMAMVTTGVQTLKTAGVPIPAAVITSINEMNVAVTTINAAVGASSNGASTAGVLAQAYVAAKQAQAAVATAGGALVGAIPVPPPTQTAAQGSGA